MLLHLTAFSQNKFICIWISLLLHSICVGNNFIKFSLSQILLGSSLIVDFVLLTQTSMSVQQTMEDAVLKPAVVTRWVVSHVPVTAVSWEMDSLVLVSQLRNMHV